MTLPDPPPERVNILLVDDRPNNLMSLQALLDRPDYNLLTARSGQEALAQVLRHELAVILLDVAMPGMDGFETASIIKQRDQSRLIPIIFITASVYDMEHVFRGYTMGAVDYLRKPIDPQAVRGKVEVFVEMFRQRKQIGRQAARLREAELREQRLQRHRAEEALRQSESLYQLTFEEAPVGIGHATPDGLLTSGNRRLGELLGWDLPDLIGRSIADLATGEERAGLVDRIALLCAGGPHYSGEHRLTSRSDEVVWVEVTLSALRDGADGAVRQLILVINDISARKLAELERSRLVRELQEGIRARDDFLSLASHELKTPITPLRLQTESILRRLGNGPGTRIPPDQLARRLAVVNRAAERLEALIYRLLDVSRVNVGAINLELADVDLWAVVRDVVKRMQYDAQRAGSTISVHAKERVVGMWDRLRLDQVVSNLLSNAIKYGNARPIDITIGAEDGAARLSVRDRGEGIPAEAQERIFERFERVAPIRRYGGFGLGLWIVRQLVEAHGGEVTVSSRPGDGSEFIVELPRRPAEETARQPVADELAPEATH